MEEISRFVTLFRSGHFTVTDRCEQFGISPKTGYKHRERCAAQGLAGLQPDCSFHLLSEHGGRF
jgi:hypothetical protein